MPVSESSSYSWNREQDVQFERALAAYPEDLSDRWEKIAAELPCYNSSSDGSSSPGGDEGIGKKNGNLGLLSSDSNHASKSSRSDQERRKGIAWTEDEHRS